MVLTFINALIWFQSIVVITTVDGGQEKRTVVKYKTLNPDWADNKEDYVLYVQEHNFCCYSVVPRAFLLRVFSTSVFSLQRDYFCEHGALFRHIR